MLHKIFHSLLALAENSLSNRIVEDWPDAEAEYEESKVDWLSEENTLYS